jgi:hypothetical protein
MLVIDIRTTCICIFSSFALLSRWQVIPSKPSSVGPLTRTLQDDTHVLPTLHYSGHNHSPLTLPNTPNTRSSSSSPTRGLMNGYEPIPHHVVHISMDKRELALLKNQNTSSATMGSQSRFYSDAVNGNWHSAVPLPPPPPYSEAIAPASIVPDYENERRPASSTSPRAVRLTGRINGYLRSRSKTQPSSWRKGAGLAVLGIARTVSSLIVLA